MKRLVLLGEGHGDVAALPILIGKLLKERNVQDKIFVDHDVIRSNPASLVKWNKGKNEPDFEKWIARISLAARRSNVGGVLAVYDGDAKKFPAGSMSPFCAATAAKSMAASAVSAGAGKMFSLSVVFACPEYETWLVAGAESFAGRRLNDGRLVLPAHVSIPSSDHESRGKGWLERNCSGYRPTRDQRALTEVLECEFVRAKSLRSFVRLERALDQILEAVTNDCPVSTPI